MENSMSRRQFVFAGSAATFAALSMVACGGSERPASEGSASAAADVAYKDGTYTGQSEVIDEDQDAAGYGVITVTIQDGVIVDAAFEPYDMDGKLKGADYTLPAVVDAGQRYAEELVDAGSLDGVDAETGATYMYDQFVGAVEDALSQAAE